MKTEKGKMNQFQKILRQSTTLYEQNGRKKSEIYRMAL